MMRTFWARGVAWSHTSVLGSAAARVKLAVNFEDRLATVLTQMVRVRAEYGDWLASTLQRLEERWRIGLFDRAGLLRLSVTYRRLRGPWHTAMQRADDLIERCLVSNLQTGGDFEIALTYIETRHPGSERSFFDDPLKQDLTRRFKRFLSDSLRELSGSNATDVAGVIGELGRVAALFEVRDRRLAQIEARLGRFEANAGEVPALPPPPPDEQTDAANAERDLDRLFHYLVQPIGEGADAMRRATATRSRLSHEVGQN